MRSDAMIGALVLAGALLVPAARAEEGLKLDWGNRDPMPAFRAALAERGQELPRAEKGKVRSWGEARFSEPRFDASAALEAGPVLLQAGHRDPHHRYTPPQRRYDGPHEGAHWGWYRDQYGNPYYGPHRGTHWGDHGGRGDYPQVHPDYRRPYDWRNDPQHRYSHPQRPHDGPHGGFHYDPWNGLHGGRHHGPHDGHPGFGIPRGGRGGGGHGGRHHDPQDGRPGHGNPRGGHGGGGRHQR